MLESGFIDVGDDLCYGWAVPWSLYYYLCGTHWRSRKEDCDTRDQQCAGQLPEGWSGLRL